MKLGFSLQNSYCVPMQELLALLRTVGFDAVSPAWHWDLDLQGLAAAAHDQGLFLQSLHGPIRGMPEFWGRDESASSPVLQGLLQALDDCAACRIPILVVHAWGGVHYKFQPSDLWFGNFDRLVDRACSKGVQIAFENLEGPEYLAALMAHFREEPSVGLCWDSGHACCYTPSWDFLRDYGDRLLMTHLNDNLGNTHPDGQLQTTDDLHLLPYDGILDWAHIAYRLKQAKKQEVLNFELKIRPKGDRCTRDLYSQLPLDTYLRRAYQAASCAAAAYFA